MDTKRVVNIVIYVIIILILWFATKSERADINCADIEQTICGEGKGRAYYNSRPLDGDSRDVLLDKLVKTANYDRISVHWRKAMIVAIISGFIVAYLLHGKFPDGQSYAMAILTIFIIAYSSQMTFQSKVTMPAMKQVDEIVRRLR